MIARHGVRVRLRARPPAEWAALPLDRFGDEFFSPCVRFLERHPAYVRVSMGGCGPTKNADLGAAVRGCFLDVLALRLPHVGAAERARCGALVFAMGNGGYLQLSSGTPPADLTRVAEFLRAVVAYLPTYAA